MAIDIFRIDRSRGPVWYDHDGAITLTIPTPERLRLAPDQLHDALAAA
jgi:hypothetical protein